MFLSRYVYLGVVICFFGTCSQIMADTIVVEEVVEAKTPVEYSLFEVQTVTRMSQMGPTISCITGRPCPGTTFFKQNQEQILVPIGTLTITPYNVYNRVIEVPSVASAVDVYWFMAADSGTGIGSMPPGMILQSASMLGSRGTYVADITLVHDLANLPTSSANDLSIQWDLSAMTQTTGDFYLAHVIMPISEFIPEPSTILLLMVGAIGRLSCRP